MSRAARAWSLALVLCSALSGCNFGVPIAQPGGGTEGEGLTGVLVDASGSAVANARVRIYEAADTTLHPAPEPVDEVTSGRRGHYRFHSLPGGTYNLEAAAERNGNVIGLFRAGIVVQDGNRERGRDTLRAPGQAHVLLRHGAHPVHGALCAVPASPFRAISDAQGRCALQGVPPGAYRIKVERPGFLPALIEGLVVLSGPAPAETTLNLTGIPAPDSAAQDTIAYDTSLVAVADTYVRGTPGSAGADLSAGENSGADTRLNIGNSGDDLVARILLRFAIPEGSGGDRIARAVVRLTPIHWVSGDLRDDPYRIDLHAVLRDWKEGSGTVTPNGPAVDGATALDRFWGARDGSEAWSRKLVGLNDTDATARVIAGSSRLQRTWATWEFDITELARQWADHPDENHGILLIGEEFAPPDNLPTHPYFHSREAAQPDSAKPQLLLQWAP